MSGPVVAGACALVLEANPWLSAQQVKQIIKQTARTDNFTGTIAAPGSPLWGMGKLNAYAAVQQALSLLEAPDFTMAAPWNIFPNPARETIQLTLDHGIPTFCKIIDQ